MIATKIAAVANSRFQKLTSNSADRRVTTPIKSNTKEISPMAITKCTTIGWMVSIQGRLCSLSGGSSSSMVPIPNTIDLHAGESQPATPKAVMLCYTAMSIS